MKGKRRGRQEKWWDANSKCGHKQTLPALGKLNTGKGTVVKSSVVAYDLARCEIEYKLGAVKFANLAS